MHLRERSHSGLVRRFAKSLYGLNRIEGSNPSLSELPNRARKGADFVMRRGAKCLNTSREGFERRSDVARARATASQGRAASSATELEERLTESLPAS